MKYLMMTFGSAAEMQETKSKEWISNMFEFMNTFNDGLRERGEWVDGQGLADPETATRVDWQDGAPVATDGPYPEAKESVVGYWVIDVENDERAVELAKEVVAGIEEGPIEVRRIMDAPPEV